MELSRPWCERGRSLLAAGVVRVEGSFDADDAVEIVDGAGTVVAKGLVRADHATAARAAGRRTADLEDGMEELVHRDDMVVMPQAK